MRQMLLVVFSRSGATFTMAVAAAQARVLRGAPSPARYNKTRLSPFSYQFPGAHSERHCEHNMERKWNLLFRVWFGHQWIIAGLTPEEISRFRTACRSSEWLTFAIPSRREINSHRDISAKQENTAAEDNTDNFVSDGRILPPFVCRETETIIFTWRI